MAHLKAMSKISLGGWSIEDAANRRKYQECGFAAKTSHNCVILATNRAGEEPHEFAGICGFRAIDWWNRSAEMGVIVHPRYFRRGISTKVHMICMRLGFEGLHLNRIEFRTASSNTAMITFCREVIGATYEGTMRDFFPTGRIVKNASTFNPSKNTTDSATSFLVASESNEQQIGNVNAEFRLQASQLSIAAPEEPEYEDGDLYSVLASEWPCAKESITRKLLLIAD